MATASSDPLSRNWIPGFGANYVATIGNNGAAGDIRSCANGELVEVWHGTPPSLPTVLGVSAAALL